MVRLLICALALAGAAAAQNAPDREDWVQLFNGRDMSGWTPKIRGYALGQNYGNTFRVEDGVLKVGYEAYDDFSERFGHLFYENESYGYYRLRVEYRFVGDQAPNGPGWAGRNSGIMIHGQPAATMGLDQDFPHMLGIMLDGRRDSVEADDPLGLLCHGDRISISVWRA